jgi:hypothetical protein
VSSRAIDHRSDWCAAWSAIRAVRKRRGVVQCCGDAHLSNFGVFASPEGHCAPGERVKPRPFLKSARRSATAYAMIIRTDTRVGRVGRARDKKSRAGPARRQNGHVSWSVSNSGPSAIAIGASQRLQARVPTPSSVDRIAWRFSSCTAAARRASAESSGVWPRPRKSVTTMSLDRAAHPRLSCVRTPKPEVADLQGFVAPKKGFEPLSFGSVDAHFPSG